MGIWSNLFDVLRNSSYEDIEDETKRDVTIALAGNTAEARDRLQHALSTRLESLWTPSPFKLIETTERPTTEADERDGLLLYGLYGGDRIPSEKRKWLRDLALSQGVKVVLIVLDRKNEEPFTRQTPNLGERIQAMNPLRFMGGNQENRPPTTNAAADGAAFNNAGVETRPSWQVELEQLIAETNNRMNVVNLKNTELGDLQEELLPMIVKQLAGRELALARRAPIFRNTVASHLIQQTARGNIETLLLANITAGVPIVSAFFDSGADFVLLTRGQIELGHRLAAVYGQKRESRVEVYLEIIPLILAGFLWKAVSQQVGKKLPPLLTILPKAVIAFGATLVVGRLTQMYYASGRKAPSQVAAFVRNIVAMVTGKQAEQAEDQADAPRQLRSS